MPANAAAGAYYVIGQADGDGQIPESIESNNTKASSTIKVGPDLIVTAISVPGSAAAGGTISVTDTTTNQGAGAAGASTTGFYLSSNASTDASDKFLGSRPVGELASNGAATASALLSIPADTPPGSYYVIGRADWNNVVAETAETNNDRNSTATIKIGGDLVVSAISASATGRANGPITVTDTIKNQGTVPVSESVTGFYLSLNGTYDSTDPFLGSRVVGSLGPSATNTASTEVIIPPGTTPGLYSVIAVADVNGVVAESVETNNTRNTTALIDIGPDLTVTALTAPSSATAGTSITASDTTTNQGGDTAPGSGTSYFLSTNTSFDTGDLFLATRQVVSLGPGMSQAGSVTFSIPASTAAGTYYIVAKSDGENAILEAHETNNTRAKSISIVAAPPP